MQDNGQTLDTNEEEQFREFKRLKRIEEAKASVLKMECDCLSPRLDKSSLAETCKRADKLELGAIVVFPTAVKACVAYLGKDPKVSLIASVSHPYGEETTEVKATAVKRAVKDGVDEVEVCAPAAFIRDGNWAYLKKECKKIKKAAKNCAVRMTFDCAVIDEKLLLRACAVAADAGINCVRLNNCDGEIISAVKSAVKGKCLIKADKADNAVTFANMCVMGADVVNCVSACDMASYVLGQTEYN